jgi:oxalate decarboxylase/phosphoglucose isomerase-like protein (cupin superfamily)
MGFCVNKSDVPAVEIAPGVIKRVLLRPDQTGTGPPGELTVTHYTLTEGGVLILEEPNVEYQDYIVSGTALFGRRYIHANTTIFVPSDRKHTYIHAGESDLIILSHTYSVPHPSHPWCKTRLAQLTEPYEQQLMTEEFHALVGAHRFHALDVQTYDRGEHTNPEETAYFMRGTGEMLAGDKWYKVRPGSLVYVEEGETHAIRNTNEKGYPLHYFVMEYVEQDKMWSARGYQGRI